MSETAREILSTRGDCGVLIGHRGFQTPLGRFLLRSVLLGACVGVDVILNCCLPGTAEVLFLTLRAFLCCRPWNVSAQCSQSLTCVFAFLNFPGGQEELAFVFEMLQQLEDALVQYDELDALFSQYVVNFGAGGEW